MPLGRRGRCFVMSALLHLSTARSSTTFSLARHRCPMSMPPKSAFSPARIPRAPRGSTLTLTDWLPSCCLDLPPADKRACSAARHVVLYLLARTDTPYVETHGSW